MNANLGLIMAIGICTFGAVANDALAQVQAPFDLGPYAVGHRSFEVSYPFGRSGTRTIPVDAWYPVDPSDANGPMASYAPLLNNTWAFPSQLAHEGDPVSAAGPFPLVVLSHGYSGNRASLSALNEHLATHGFIVAAPSHVGNTTGEPLVEPAPFLWTRQKDAVNVIDKILAKNTNVDDAFAGRIDAESIGIAGHSYGAGTAVLASGGLTVSVPGVFDDPRIRAVMDISTYFPTDQVINYPGPQEPFLMLNGSRDGFRQDFSAFDGMRTAPRYLIEIAGASHNSYQEICAPAEYARLNGAPNTLLNYYSGDIAATCDPDRIPNAEAVDLTNMLATAFFKTYLDGELQYANYLSESYAGAMGLPLTVRAVILGDADNDGDVDLEDLNLVRNNFGLVDESAILAGDTNNDHQVDLADLNNVRNNFGMTATGAAVPEPSMLALAIVGIIFAGNSARSRNRRRRS